MDWTPEAVAMLKALVGQGMSASQIGMRFGCTRNAVIGKMKREGIKSLNRPYGTIETRARRRTPTNYKTRDKTRDPKTKTGFHFSWGQPRAPAPEPVQAPAAPAFIPPAATRKSLLDLAAGDCRWPCGHPGEPTFFFCGMPQVEQRSYCADHCRIAYVPAPPRRRQPLWRDAA